ncbi:MAG: hypothetical protein OEN52_09700 [Gammaproteobacteria bacterium]|nr:hypothetical protein [Gammaproteobacteria bacterium]
MSNMMAVFLNGIAQLEYDRDKPLPDHQIVYLEKMDTRMDAGILVGEETIEHPDENQRAQFVAANLLHAINSDDESMAAALCSYLANRLPDLKQVSIEDTEGEVSIELIFDRDYRKQVPVQFTPFH